MIHVGVCQALEEVVVSRYLGVFHPPFTCCRTCFYLRRVGHTGQNGCELRESDIAIWVRFVDTGAIDYAVVPGLINRVAGLVTLRDVRKASGLGKGEVGQHGGYRKKF